MSLIIAIGGCAAAVCAILLKHTDKRSIVCWTLAALTLALAGGAFLGTHENFSADMSVIIPALMAAGAVLAVVLALELAAPARRFRGKKTDYDERRSERALELVLAIVTAVLAAAAGLSGVIIPENMGALLLVPALGISIRQVSYGLYCAKADSLAPKSPTELRGEITRKLGGTSSRL